VYLPCRNKYVTICILFFCSGRNYGVALLVSGAKFVWLFAFEPQVQGSQDILFTIKSQTCRLRPGNTEIGMKWKRNSARGLGNQVLRGLVGQKQLRVLSCLRLHLAAPSSNGEKSGFI
jgi:hypothetical protein